MVRLSKGGLPAVFFVPKTLEKKRGYGTRVEDDQPGVTPEELAAISDEELEHRAKRLGLN